MHDLLWGMNIFPQCINFARYEIFLRCIHFCEVWNLLAMHGFSARYEILSWCMNIKSRCMNWLLMHDLLRGMNIFLQCINFTRYEIFLRCIHFCEVWNLLAMHELTSDASIDSRCMIFCGAWISSCNAYFFKKIILKTRRVAYVSHRNENQVRVVRADMSWKICTNFFF